MDSTLRRTWAEIDMDALAHNYETLRKRIGENVKFLGVVKADAYDIYLWTWFCSGEQAFTGVRC